MKSTMCLPSSQTPKFYFETAEADLLAELRRRDTDASQNEKTLKQTNKRITEGPATPFNQRFDYAS